MSEIEIIQESSDSITKNNNSVSNTISNLEANALAALNSANYIESFYNATKLLDIDLNNVVAKKCYAISAYNLFSYDKIIYYLKDVVNADNFNQSQVITDYKDFLYLGLTYFDIGNIDLSLEYLKKAYDLFAMDYKVNHYLGLCYFNLNDFANAKKHFSLALKVNGFATETVSLLLSLYNGHPELFSAEEISDLVKSVEDNAISTNNEQMFLILIDYYNSQMDFQKSLMYYQKLLNINKKSDYYIGRSYIYYRLGDFDNTYNDAVVAFSLLNDNDNNSLFRIGNIVFDLYGDNDFKDKIDKNFFTDIIDKIISNPNSSLYVYVKLSALLYKTDFLMQNNNYTDAIKYFEQYFDLLNNDLNLNLIENNVAVNYAVTLERTGDTEKAIKFLEDYLESQEDVNVMQKLLMFYAMRGETGRVKLMAEKIENLQKTQQNV